MTRRLNSALTALALPVLLTRLAGGMRQQQKEFYVDRHECSTGQRFHRGVGRLAHGWLGRFHRKRILADIYAEPSRPRGCRSPRS